MSHLHDGAPLTPRRGVTLVVLIVCRISGMNQDLESLADQEARMRSIVAGLYDGPVEYHVIASRASGELLDRAELAEIEQLLEDRRFDLLITEDLGRIARRTRAFDLCELAVDCGVRVLAVNDSIDTGRDGWEMNAFFSVIRHEMYNRDTSSRIRRTLRNRFVQGGVIQFVLYGYDKPKGAKNDSELRKDPAAEAVYDAWFTKLEDGASYEEVADWLNAQKIPPGPCVRRHQHWTGELVRLTTFNPILKGLRVRNDMISKRVNKTGHHRSVKAPPEERLERQVPHLAFIAPERYDRVVALLKCRNARYRRRGEDGVDPRRGVPRKRTRWPGQHVICGICNRPCHYGGHGSMDHLVCSGCRDYKCWNAVSFHGGDAAARLARAILAEVAALPEFDPVFLDLMREKAEAARDAVTGKYAEAGHRLRTLDTQIARATRLLLQDDEPSPALRTELRSLEAERDRARAEQARWQHRPEGPIELPSMERIKGVIADAFAGLAHDSPEFGRRMRALVPRLEIRPYRLCDGGKLVLRAHLTIDLTALAPEVSGLGDLGDWWRRQLVVDLFDAPQRAAYLRQVLAMKAEGRTEVQIARAVGITKTAVQHAAALAREMTRQGLSDPYVPVTEPPDDGGRLKRHEHPRYRFEPLDRPQERQPDQKVEREEDRPQEQEVA
jgi:DNA invertase Pin-like site-specific DNA recombinase